jgi:transcriptional antiterminator NusG
LSLVSSQLSNTAFIDTHDADPAGSPERGLRFPWFGLRTRSNQERITASVLEQKGYEHYLPTYRTSRRWSDRIVESDQPLFPGYVFCRFDPKKRLPIITTPGVVSIVGFGSEPAPIADNEIEAVQSILRSGLPSEPCSFLQEGQRIRVTRSSLEGLEGILVKKKTEWRMVVSISLLQRSISVEIDRDCIVAV